MHSKTRRSVVRFGDISVEFEPALDGGGSRFGQEFIEVVAERLGSREHIFEFCAGPGFIGFSLLAHGLCEKLTLADINPEAVLACQATIQLNGLEDCCSAYVSDVFEFIPEAEHWDLIVGNPPHWPQSHAGERDLRKYDIGLSIHRRFFERARTFLRPGGSVLLQENSFATRATDFECMIADGGFRLIDVFKATEDSNFYFMLCE
jgi:methylase of polypeptide subunit release factors